MELTENCLLFFYMKKMNLDACRITTFKKNSFNYWHLVRKNQIFEILFINVFMMFINVFMIIRKKNKVQENFRILKIEQKSIK